MVGEAYSLIIINWLRSEWLVICAGFGMRGSSSIEEGE